MTLSNPGPAFPSTCWVCGHSGQAYLFAPRPYVAHLHGRCDLPPRDRDHPEAAQMIRKAAA